MATEITTVIDGYTVEYTPKNDNGLTDCHIWKAGLTRPAYYSASLQVLIDFGVLTNSQGAEMSVPQTTIDKIEAWANEQGWDQ